MQNYFHRTQVRAPLEKVAAFHNDTLALKTLTPPGIFVQFVHVEPLQENSKAEFIMWLGPLPVHWMAIHSDVSPNGFTDTQANGPYKYWRHRHSFLVIDQAHTEIVDEVEYECSQHPFWLVVSRFMALNLPVLFAYRTWATRRRLGSLQ
jgi:ligand-binding SRPBCC domain-containing protein